MTKRNWHDILIEADLRGDNESLQDIADKYGVNKTTLCNRLNAFRIGRELNKGDNYESSIATRENNIRKSQYRLANQRSEINKELKKEAFFEEFIDKYVVPTITPLNIPTKPKPTQQGTQRFFLADFHFLTEESSSKDIINLTQSLIEQWDGSLKVVFNLMGDYIENTHHRQQQISKVSSTMDQVIGVSNHILDMIGHFIKNTGAIVEVYVVGGNHDSIRQLGIQSRDDITESYAYLIGEVLKKGLGKKVKVHSNNIEDCHQEDIYFLHGDTVKGVFKDWMKVKREQEHDKFKDTKYFLKGHSHKFEHIIPKGTRHHYIDVPSIKTWASQWEKDNNQIGTPGYVVEKNREFKFVQL